jgi:hypothetical protein
MNDITVIYYGATSLKGGQVGWTFCPPFRRGCLKGGGRLVMEGLVIMYHIEYNNREVFIQSYVL